VLIGLAFGIGVLITIVGARSLGPRPLADRVASAVAAVSPGARAHLQSRADGPTALLGLAEGPVADAVRSTVGGILSDRRTIERRLRRNGSRRSVEQYRSTRVTASVVASVVGAGVALVAMLRGASGASILVVPLLALLVAAVVDLLHERRARARARRLIDELPVVLEFLAMSLSAGEGMIDALRRASTVGRGELSGEFGGVVGRVSAGGSVVGELRALADDLDVPPIGRALEQLIGALERGAPIAEVLRAQAQDAREDERARLLESVGKTEVRMLVPLVLVILPATVILAIWPGIMVLRLGF
jgi:tight adherence protein C